MPGDQEFQGKFGADDPNMAIDYRLEVIFREYPYLRPFYNATRLMVPDSPEEWIEDAQLIAHIDEDPVVQQMALRDPDFPIKYKFMWSIAMMDNPHLDRETKEKIRQVITGKTQDDTPADVSSA